MHNEIAIMKGLLMSAVSRKIVNSKKLFSNEPFIIVKGDEFTLLKIKNGRRYVLSHACILFRGLFGFYEDVVVGFINSRATFKLLFESSMKTISWDWSESNNKELLKFYNKWYVRSVKKYAVYVRCDLVGL